MNKKVVLFLALSLSAAIVIACEVIPSIVSPPVKVSGYKTLQQKWEMIGDALNVAYGNSLKDKEVYVVKTMVYACVFNICSENLVSWAKPCDKTFKEAAYAIGASGPGGGGGSGGSAGGGLGGGIGSSDPGGSQCSIETSRGCVSVDGGSQTCYFNAWLDCPP
jgi:uncharacterized membrane protein YgcG